MHRAQQADLVVVTECLDGQAGRGREAPDREQCVTLVHAANDARSPYGRVKRSPWPFPCTGVFSGDLERKRHRLAWRLGLAAAIVEAVLVSSVATFAASPPPPGLLVTPVIDGKIGHNEWVDASHLSLPFKGHRGTLYLEHDSRYLYVLLVVRDSRLPASCCNAAVYFDKNHDGVLQRGEDAMMFKGSGVDEFWDGSSWVNDVSDKGKDDVQTAERYDAATGHVILEGRKPLCSGDRAHDFCEKPVGTVG